MGLGEHVEIGPGGGQTRDLICRASLRWAVILPGEADSDVHITPGERLHRRGCGVNFVEPA
ncbi:MAG TPA: hypothetical protein VKV17_02135 [Bryobacteraceae bacterium]|nr:hypothetical protein [Bryobacteraceae bacterium]